MTTLSLRPLVLRVDDFLERSECERIIELARPKLKGSLVMGDARAAERTSSSVFLGAADDELLRTLQRRLAALVQLPLADIERSEDVQVVHYEAGATFGMHHDSSAFHPRLLTAFYYLNDVERGGETAFPCADGAMAPADAMRLQEPAAEGEGLVVAPQRGTAVLFYNHDESGAIEPAAVHAGCRVLAGEKWGANHWVRLPSAKAQAPPTAAAPSESGETAALGGEREPGQPATGTGKNAAKNRKKREKAKLKREGERGDSESGEPKDEL